MADVLLISISIAVPEIFKSPIPSKEASSAFAFNAVQVRLGLFLSFINANAKSTLVTLNPTSWTPTKAETSFALIDTTSILLSSLSPSNCRDFVVFSNANSPSITIKSKRFTWKLAEALILSPLSVSIVNSLSPPSLIVNAFCV